LCGLMTALISVTGHAESASVPLGAGTYVWRESTEGAVKRGERSTWTLEVKEDGASLRFTLESAPMRVGGHRRSADLPWKLEREQQAAVAIRREGVLVLMDVGEPLARRLRCVWTTVSTLAPLAELRSAGDCGKNRWQPGRRRKIDVLRCDRERTHHDTPYEESWMFARNPGVELFREESDCVSGNAYRRLR
jgi:hypothetical protein